MQIKKNDFIEVEYTGKTKDEGIVFDTTDEKTAKENEIDTGKMTFGPVIICVGEGQLIKGLDEQIEGKEIGKYTINIAPENAFGKKSAKLIQLIATNKFLKENINPVPGLQVNIDGIMGIVKSVSGGRTLVDFNHPLSGRDIVYEIKINRIVTDEKEKINGYLKLALNQKEPKFTIENEELKIELQQTYPNEAKKQLAEKILKLIPSIKKVTFSK